MITSNDNNNNNNNNGNNDNDIGQTIRDAQSAVPTRREIAGAHASRFILFHMPFSICSFKVRVTMAECGLGYISHELDPSKALDQLYHPAYVKLRLQAWYDLGKPPLAGEGSVGKEWTGVTSVDTQGLDLIVVPTLVDMEGGNDKDETNTESSSFSRKPKVIVNADTICRYIASLPVVKEQERRRQRHDLLPPQHEESIDKYLKLVDTTPHMALLYDGHSETDHRPYFLQWGLVRHASAVPQLQHRLAQRGQTWEGDDIERAYRAKLARKQHGASVAQLSPEARAAYGKRTLQTTRNGLMQLEQDLSVLSSSLSLSSSSSSPLWICGTPHPTLADLFLGISLYRLAWLGNQWMWEGTPTPETTSHFSSSSLPHVTKFAQDCFALPSLQEAAIFFSTPLVIPRSRSVTYLYRQYRGLWAAWQNEQGVALLNGVAYFKTHPRVAATAKVVVGTATIVAATAAAVYLASTTTTSTTNTPRSNQKS